MNSINERAKKLVFDRGFAQGELAMDENHPRVKWLNDFSQYALEQKFAGEVAECGVFRGNFAYYINKYFSDRTLYLFDTFAGFTTDDLIIEQSIADPDFNCGKFGGDRAKTAFRGTNENYVLAKMPHSQKCVIKKGYFPETTCGITDNFCFVNLDMDLYAPMLAGLRFFYPRLTGGGVVLLHDYFNRDLPGVKKAVNDFERENSCVFPKIPIGDNCSLAIAKM